MLDDLNDQQRRAAEAGDGPVLIMAGPGTGKTKTLAARIAYLLHKGVNPNRILALTFTVKAAAEMRDRVLALGQTGEPRISTFHALGYALLQEANQTVNPIFISEADRVALIRELPRPKGMASLPLRELVLAVSRYKGAVNTGGEDRVISRFVASYQRRLHEKGLIDFDDLLFQTHQFLGASTSVELRSRYDYILIDEFQDTSELQWEIIQRLRGNDNIFVIGDPKQSIYGFRGASTDMFARFVQDFPTRQEVTLRTNYRSAQAIVRLASAIFGGSDALESHSSEAGEVWATQTLNEFSEADYVLQQIEEGIGGSDLLKAGPDQGGARFKDFAVLYRTHRTARVLQQRLHDSGIPFQVVGEGSPYDQPEVQTVIELLRYCAGGKPPVVKGFSGGQVEVLAGGLDRTLPVSSLAQQCIEVFGLATDARKQQQLVQLVGTLVRFDADPDGLQKSLRYVDGLVQEGFYDPQADAVTLLTIHASKGLEFQRVLVLAAEEGSLPHIRKTLETDFDEERRLFYVAATRAKMRLDIIYAKRRSNTISQVSRFVAELSREDLPRRNDPALGKLEKKLHRREQKNRQVTLF